MNPLEWALNYASNGLYVLPTYPIVDGKCTCPDKIYKVGPDPKKWKCSPGKHPYGNLTHGASDATIDSGKINMWWGPTMWPDAGIAINLAMSHLLDIAPDGPTDLAEFIARGLPDTLTFRSGGGDGHQHFLYRLPDSVPQTRLCLPGRYDIMSSGYCVVPPTLHASGATYEWLDQRRPVAPPLWPCELLIDHIEGRTPAAEATVPGDAVLGENGEPPLDIDRDVWSGAVAKDRSAGLWAIAGELAEAGANEATIVEALRERDITLGWNKFSARKDREERYAQTARRQLANVMPRIHLGSSGYVNGSSATTTDNDQEVDEPVRLSHVPAFPLKVLPELLQRLIRASSLPNNLLAGAYLGALTAAIGGNVRVYNGAFSERMILFIALLGMTGAGKSPALRAAWDPLEAWDAQQLATYHAALQEWRARSDAEKKADREAGIPAPRDPSVLMKNATPEAIYRRLKNQAALGLNFDELASFLKGLHRYRNSGDDDTDTALTLWEGSPLRYTRVGQGGGDGNAVDIFVPNPTPVICGGLQPYRQELLGADLEGLRPRWLVFLEDRLSDGQIVLPDENDRTEYSNLVNRLLRHRATTREWLLDALSWRRLNYHGEAWAARMHTGVGTQSMLAALPKATRHLARLGCVLAEIDLALRNDPHPPQQHQTLTDQALDRAALIVDYSLDVWNALVGNHTLALHWRTERLDQAISQVLEYLARRGGGPINANLLRKNNVAGIETGTDLDAVLKRYEERFPGTIEKRRDGANAGRSHREIRSPIRDSGPVVST